MVITKVYGHVSAISDLASEPEFQKPFQQATSHIVIMMDIIILLVGKVFNKLFGKRISLNDLESLLRELNISCAVTSDDTQLIVILATSSGLFDESVALAKNLFRSVPRKLIFPCF